MELYINNNIEEIVDGVKLSEISLILTKYFVDILINNKGLKYSFDEAIFTNEDINLLTEYGFLSDVENHYNLIPNLGESFFGIESKCFLEDYSNINKVVGVFEIPYYSGIFKHDFSIESMKELKESSYKFPDPNNSQWFGFKYQKNTVFKKISDYGFLRMSKKDKMEKEILSLSYKVFQKEDKKLKPLFIGGDHAISYPIIKGFKIAKPNKKLRIVYFDAHSDLSKSDKYLTHNNVFSKILDLGNIEVLNFGIRGPILFEESEKIEEKLLNFGSIHTLIDYLRKEPSLDTYLSIDLDVLDPSLMSSVTFPVPGGLNIGDFNHFLEKLLEYNVNIVGADIVEYNASFDYRRVGATYSSAVIYQILKTLQAAD